MTDILNLPDWKAIATRQEGAECIIDAEYTVQPKACQKCGVIDRLYRHGVKATSYRDSPIRGEPVSVLASVQRYKCRDCGETFLQPLGSIQPDMRMTVRCVEYIKTQCLRDTSVRWKLIEKYDYRCQSCGGIYDQEELHATRMGVMFSVQPMTNLTLMCSHCKVRFHTDGAIHGGPLSTL